MNTTYIVMFMLIPELVIVALSGYLHFSIITEGEYGYSIGFIAARILTYIESLLLKNYKSSKDSQSITWNIWLSSIIIPILSLTSEIILISCTDITKLKAIISVIIMFVINLTTFLLYDSLSKSYIRQSKITLLEKENELYSRQCSIMQNTTEELQSFRHDMNNNFIALSQIIDAHRYEDAQKQLRKLSDLTKEKVIYSTSGNIIIDGLINYKFQSAAKENIKTNLEIAVPIELKIDTSDIVAILGNLIDNSLDAVRKLEDKRYINLKIVFSQQRLIIRIENSHKEIIECKDGKIVTSKKNHNKHGFGISNIARAVDKYNGYMEINHTNGVFTVDIIMYI